jgi:uncharacterized membrane protein
VTPSISPLHEESVAPVSAGLIGVDVLNLNKIQGLGAPIASIGGAGTFDGIFIIGLLAVLYAVLAGEARATDRP